MKGTLSVFVALMITQTNAAEVDQFTRRFEPLADVSSIVNNKANEFLDLAIKNLNQVQYECESQEAEKKLYKELRKYYANHSKGELTIYVLKSDDVEKRKIKLDESIFKSWTMYDGFLLGRPSASESDLALGPLIRMNNIVIGTDKLEHLFGRGYSYFNNHYLKGKSIEKTLKGGVLGEKTLYGGNKLATGVFSYADLSANFNGMRFWNHILQKRDDVLGDQFGPYVSCVEGKWEKVKDIDFTHYFDDSHDEAINCSKFPTKKTAKKYSNNVLEVTASNEAFALASGCPIDPSKLNAMKEKYGKFARHILNLTADRKISYFNEF